ncbi:pseudouridine synthase [Gongronella butleri]|nr:pseudouridine synthase [Gongronella butleri]
MGSVFSKQPAAEVPEERKRRASEEAATSVQKRARSDDKTKGKNNKKGEKKGDKKRYKTNKERREYHDKHRKWGSNESERPKTDDSEKEPRHPKKKVALLFGYSGTGYSGLQFNPNVATIEQTMFDAMVKANGVSKMNSDDPRKVGWSRAARTDKGVHAAGNLVSMKLQFPVDGEAMVDAINRELPDQIRVWGYVEVFRSFNAKTLCDSRVYEYLLPCYAFAPPHKQKLYANRKDESDISVSSKDGSVVKFIRIASEEQRSKAEQYKISDSQLAAFRAAMQKYEGTHNFHNYTIGRHFNEKSANRYMINIKVSDPFLIDGVEWLSIKLHGQSFMIHQIRKMISMAVLIVRNDTPLALIDNSFENKKINIPKAPALGLLLEQPLFESYNHKIEEHKKERHKRPKDEKEHQPIDFGTYQELMDDFKKKYIYTRVFETERAERGFEQFLASVDNSMTRDFEYLQSDDGAIPDQCIIVSSKGKQAAKDEQDEMDEEED